MSPTATARIDRRPSARPVNELIDRALLHPTDTQWRAVARIGRTVAIQRLAERVRRRATVLARRDRAHGAGILRARDGVILAVYAGDTPARWHTAWCDSSVTNGAHIAGVGGLLQDAAGRQVAELARRASERTPFEAEIAALVAVVQLARAHDVERLRVYCDCSALARLWHARRDDPRLAALAVLARDFRRLQVCSLPREHNQPAHRLAKSAAASAED
jgi:ribonuclease HI